MTRGGGKTGEPGKVSGLISRRNFVKVGVVAGTGLSLGVWYKASTWPGTPPSDATFAPNAYLRIGDDGTITVIVNRSEMGQGVSTALPQLVAEELDVPWDRIDFAFAPAHPAYGSFGMQLTGGSTSVAESWIPFRQAGATAREMLKQAAGERWGVPVSELTTDAGAVVARDGTRLEYGILAAAAAAIEVPDDVPLRATGEHTLIGTSVPRLDVPAKTRGTAIFGIDAGPRTARVAVVARCPVFGGRVRSFDPAPALAVPGVEEVVEIQRGIAVVATGYVAAKAGREALVVEWDEGPAADLNDDEIFAQLDAAAREGGREVAEAGDVDAALSGVAAVTQATYRLPYLAHATMEPMNCTAWLRDDQLIVWAPTQFQNSPGILGLGARQVAAKAAGVSPGRTEIHTTFMGGGFGRRGEGDFVEEAAELASKITGPVKVVWSREDDMQHDHYRPASVHHLAATLANDGTPASWTHRMASQSIMQKIFPGWVPGFAAGFAGRRDPTSTEGASNQPYHIPNLRMTYAKVDLPVPVGFWRSVGHTHTGFVVESFIDELAHAAGQDPYAYRRALLGDHPRHLRILDAVAEAAGWGQALPEGRARGIAVVESFGSYVAEVAEVSVEAGRPRVHKVWCAVDCGTVVNPRIVEAQMRSGIIYGLTAALYGRISIERGRVVQSNFHDYPMLRMNEAPEIDVVLAPSGDEPGGVGEPGTPPIAPAVTNALFALTGKRVRELPIELG